MTLPEVLLWKHLRGSPLGFGFRKQYAIGPYVADFYCPRAKLVIEVDGAVHGTEEGLASDTIRDEHILAMGVSVMRIPANEVLKDATAIAAAIVEVCSAGPSTALRAVPLPIASRQGGFQER